MYLECLSCPKLGISCDGPNFVAMTGDELLEWCKERKRRLGWSNAMPAETSGIPKGTIDRLFSGSHTDFKYETIRPLVQALVGSELGGTPCPDAGQEENETIKRLEEDNARLNEYVDQIEKQHNEDIKELKKEKQEEIDFLKSEVKNKRGYIKTLAIALTIIFVALAVDYTNTHLGFFWREWNT